MRFFFYTFCVFPCLFIQIYWILAYWMFSMFIIHLLEMVVDNRSKSRRTAASARVMWNLLLATLFRIKSNIETKCGENLISVSIRKIDDFLEIFVWSMWIWWQFQASLKLLKKDTWMFCFFFRLKSRFLLKCSKVPNKKEKWFKQ